MARYASKTSVPVDRTRAEIERLLSQHGATAFGYLTQGGAVIVVFEIAARRVLMRLPLPSWDDRSFTRTAVRGTLRSPAEARNAYDQAVRARWRALLLIIKAKLEAIAAKITTVEREFLADIALPDGSTVGEWFAPQLDNVYSGAAMPALLPGLDGKEDPDAR